MTSFVLNSCACRTLFDVAGKKESITQLEKLSTAQTFWDDPQKASGVMQELESLKKEVADSENLGTQITDLMQLYEMADTDHERSELEEQLDDTQQHLEKLERLTFFSGAYDRGNALITIQSGAGGDDAQDWAAMLLRMYLRWAENHGYSATIIDQTDGAIAGIKSATLEITGAWVYGYLRSEHGTHRLVRLSPFNSDNLRQTSFASVEILPVIDDLPEVVINPSDLKIDTYRASGAGGQSVNKTDSAVRITHLPTGVVAACQNERSQAQNKEQALKIITAKLHQRYLDEQEAQRQKLRGAPVRAKWGNQIRSYVLHPYKLVKDHRTKHESTHIDAVLDGDIDAYIDAYLYHDVREA